MQTKNKTLLCQYLYDPLDRLVDSTYSGEEGARRFYQKDRLATETDGFVHRSIIQHEDQLLAQHQRQSDTVETRLLATDQQRTVLNVLDASGPHLIAHTPYGHSALASGLLSLLGFNGERPDPVTGHYLLGSGYRAFNPVLMRFNSPDSWSPFGKGGVNPYSYCVGDPVNRRDPTGHKWFRTLFERIRQRLNIRPDSGPRSLNGVETPSSHLAGQSSPAENLDNIDPPPPYSPPRNRPAAMAQATDPRRALTNENELLAEIRRREALASIQRSLLNDVTNGYIQHTPSEHANRVSMWNETQISIVALKHKIPPPSYVNATDIDALPEYQNAIRKT